MDCDYTRIEKTRLEQADEVIRRFLDHPRIIHWICLIILVGTLWGIIYSLTDKFVPGTQLFGMFALFVAAYAAGSFTKLLRLPALLGMLIVGIILRNVDLISFSGDYTSVSSMLRHIALFIILTRAGLGLDPKALKSLSRIILRLAFVPAFVEGLMCTVVSHYLLDLPWLWGALLGSILAAVSPAVVIPCLFSLQERGFGTDKGISTLVVAAASLDDIFSISVFGVIISVIFTPSTNLTTQLIRGPLGVLFGVIYGLIWGLLLHYVPHRNDKNMILFRVLMLAGGGIAVIFGSEVVGYPGAGPLGCIIAPVIASIGWKQDGWVQGSNPVSKVYSAIWVVFQPILFGLIGSEVDVSLLGGHVLGFGAAVLVCALIVRIIVTIFVAFGGDFTWKEKVFVAVAWFPKATVQAALGPIPLDKAREGGMKDETAYAEKVLIVAVLAILITAPIGAILIMYLGQKFLSRSTFDTTNQASKKSDSDSAEEEIGLT